MPETIILEDGTEREVPTQEELEALNTSVTEAAEFKTTAEEKELAWQTKEKELEEQANPNWKAAREKIARLEKLEATGKSLDDEGNIVDKTPAPIDQDALVNRATEAGKSAAMTALLDERKKTLMTKFDDDTKTVVEHYYNKLITGEDLNLENMDKFMKEAEALAVPQAAAAAPPISAGAPPRFKAKEGENFSDSEAGKSIANDIWGPKSYAAESNKK